MASKRPGTVDYSCFDNISTSSEQSQDESEGRKIPPSVSVKEHGTGMDNDEEQVSAQVLSIHGIPKHLCDWVKVRLPFSKLFRGAYDPVIDFQAETKLYLVAPLGRGGNGEVFFCITEDAKRCAAVKFFFYTKGVSKAQLAKTEFDRWGTIFGNDPFLPKCHLGHLCNGSSYLCMPYISIVPQRLWSFLVDEDLFGAHELRAALEMFTEAGYKQESMRWGHFGFFPVSETAEKSSSEAASRNSSPLVALPSGAFALKASASPIHDDGGTTKQQRLYMVDLGRITPFTHDCSKEAWVQESILSLRAQVPPPTGHVDLQAMRSEGYFWEKKVCIL